MMHEQPFASGLTPDECRIRAAFCRHMAKSAPVEDVSEGLVLLAEKYERMALGAGSSVAADLSL